MTFWKSFRAENKDLKNLTKDTRCVVCSRTGSDPHHVKSKGSGGPDEEWNLMPLCRIHHTEIHKIGSATFSLKYNNVLLWLNSHGWEIENGKLRR